MKVKQLTFMVLLSLSFSGCELNDINPDESYYWYGNEKIPLEVDYRKQFIVVEHIKTESELKLFLKALNCSHPKIDRFAPIMRDSTLEATNTHHALITSSCYRKLVSNEHLYYVSPIFRDSRDDELGLSYTFIVKLKNDQDFKILDTMAVAKNVRIRELIAPLAYAVACSNESDGNALEMANYFHETGLFEFSEPNLFYVNPSWSY